MQKKPLTDEQRLEQWARKYFVPTAHRFPNWHPVVLEEMALKDFEPPRSQPMAQNSIRKPEDVNCMTELSVDLAPSRFVPLTPMESGFRCDQPHAVLPRPKFTQVPSEQVTHTELYLG